MTTLSDLRTMLRTDTLRDTGTSQRWSDGILNRYINMGIRELWPKCFVYATDSSTVTTQTAGIQTYTDREYSLPAGVPDYPNRCPVWMVEVGPEGGQRVSDSLQFGDRYRVLATGLARDPAWKVDFGRGKLILRDTPPYDSAGTYQYFIRMHYVRPIAELSSDSETLEGPPGVPAFLMEWAFAEANRQRMTLNVSNQDRLSGYGAMRKQSTELQDRLMIRWGIKMTWPQKVV